MFWVLLGNRGGVGDPPAGDPPVGDPPANEPPVNEPPVNEPPADWRATLPEEIKAHPVLKKYKDSTEAVKALVEAQSLIGADKIIIPGKNATDKEWNERVFDRLGRPSKADGYALPTDLKIPKELPVDPKIIGGFKETAHKFGLLPHQVAGIYKWFMEGQIADFNNYNKTQTDTMQTAETGLRREWGAAYDQNVAIARKVVAAYAGEDAVALLAEGKGNDPRFIRLFANIGKVLSEDQLTGKPKGLTLTPEEAQAEIDKIKGDMKGPFWDAAHPEHKAVVEKVDTLTRMTLPA
jgi:hypothetical protein